MKNKKKVGIIVPYRDRYEHLETFKTKIIEYLTKNSYNFVLIIVEQDNAKLFNRGMLLNIGFTYAEQLKCDYVVFHDVDMIPIDVDYSYNEEPLHLATNFISKEKKIIFDTYFGGVTLFPIEDFKKINGFSNKYWGWGFEDDDLLLRCVKNNIFLDTLSIKNQFYKEQCLKLNGVNAYIKGKNIFNLNRNLTFYVSFYPENITYNHEKDNDTFTIFSIPGYDFAINYNSFMRYSFVCFDKDKNVLFVNSNIKINYNTSICVTVNNKEKEIRVYQDNEFIGSTFFNEHLYFYKKEENFYLGVGNPNRDIDQNYLKGYFNQFLVFNDVLNEDEIKNLPNTLNDEKILLHFNTNSINEYQLVDLSGNNNNGEIVNCEIVNIDESEYKNIKIPFRRKSTFELLEHEENGYFENTWKTKFTRWNQLRFNNEVSKNDDLLYNDGLSDLKFIEYGKIIEKNIIHVNIGI